MLLHSHRIQNAYIPNYKHVYINQVLPLLDNTLNHKRIKVSVSFLRLFVHLVQVSAYDIDVEFFLFLVIVDDKSCKHIILRYYYQQQIVFSLA